MPVRSTSSRPTSRHPRTALSDRDAAGRSQPLRTCVGCRSRRPQDQLLRFHTDDQGRLRLDRNGPGRGAWICTATSVACLEVAVDKRAIDRAMRRKVDRDSVAEVLAQLLDRPESS